MKKCSMQKKIESFKKNEDTNDTARVWFCKHKDDDGVDEFAVFVDDYQNGYFGCYAHVGQHSKADPDYIAECTPVRKPKTTDLYKELTQVVGYNLVVCDTCVAEDIMGITLNVSDAMRMREKPEDYDLNVENYEG